MGDVAVQRCDFLDQARSDGLVLGTGHQEDGLDVPVELHVHADHLELVFEVGDRTQAADDGLGPHLLGEVHQQDVERFHRNGDARLLGDACRLVAHHLDTLFQREQRAFCLVDGHANHEVIDQLGGTLDDVEMPVGDRVKGAWIEARPFRHAAICPCERNGAAS